MSAVAGFVVPWLPHPLLAPQKNAGWQAIRTAFEQARADIERSNADVLVLYSTRWVSVIGHQIQADPAPTWVHVDEDFHDLGSMPYTFRMDPALAEATREAATQRGLHARTVAYKGFPIDTGTIVALQLLNPDNRLPAIALSCNMYADRAETLVLGKAARDAVDRLGKRAVGVAVTSLSNRLWTREVPPEQDGISSLQDDEWNRKLLEFFAEGRLEDVSQLMRQFTSQAHADSKGKAIWWLASFLGQHNRYDGKVYAYKPISGAGAAVIGLTPSEKAAADLEFDEEDAERYQGDRQVLSGGGSTPAAAPVEKPATNKVIAENAPAPVGPYPHARREGPFLFVSGMGPRQPGTNEIPGGPVRDAEGKPLPYDVAAQTRATIDNVRKVLEASGSKLEDVVDVSVFLIDMQRDFDTFNKVYREYFGSIGPTRTTVAVSALPTPIAVELKVVARSG